MNYIEYVPNIPKIGGRYKSETSGVIYELVSVVLNILGWVVVLHNPIDDNTVTPELENFETHFRYME